MGSAGNIAPTTTLEDLALGKLSTRESLIREIQHRVRAELVSQSDFNRGLNGPLGEQIAIASGNFSLDFCDPEHVAEGICNWLDKYFLKPPQEQPACSDVGASHCPHVPAGTGDCCYCGKADAA